MAAQHRPQRIISILGMHRSGTSLLTGSLQQYGLELGKYHTWNRHNRKGNRENQDIVDLHDALLARNGGSWDQPPADFRWNEEDLAKARQILAGNAKRPLWGFKDPRTLFTRSLWKHLCPDINFVGIFRHPISVAKSLNKRNNFTLKMGLRLWQQYNEALLQEHRSGAFPILCFDWDIDRFHARLDEVTKELGINAALGGSPFYSEDLHHHAYRRTDDLPIEVRELYDHLRSICDAS